MKCEMSRVINANYVKYDALKKLIIENFKGSNINTMFIYIDMYSICKSLYNDNVVIEDYTILTSNIINMCAHYRDFFRRMNVDTAFFIINSQNHPHMNTQLVSNYNDKVYNDFIVNAQMSDMIKQNNELLEIICPYLPDICFINRTSEVSVIACDIMRKYDMNDNFAHMVISKDPYTWQLVTTKPNTVILRPKKKDGVDISYMINRGNVMQHYYTLRKIKQQSTLISPELLTVILAATSLPERNIKSMVSASKVIQALNSLIIDKRIINGYNSDPIFIYTELQNMGISKISPYIASARFKAIDVACQQIAYMNTIEALYSTEILNLTDPNGVKEINEKFFKDNPLDLNRL